MPDPATDPTPAAGRIVRFRNRHARPGPLLRFHRWAGKHLVIYTALWGAVLGGFSFFYKEVLQPRTAPVNISLSLELKKFRAPLALQDLHGQPLIAVEMQLAATNPSTREVFILPNVWVAYGYRARGRTPDDAAFSRQLNEHLGQHIARPAERGATTSAGVAVAGGVLIEDSQLKPGEKVQRKLVFHVLKDAWDVIEVWTALPTTSKPDRLRTEWRIEDNRMLMGAFYVKTGKPVPRDGYGRYLDDGSDFQRSTSRVAMNLWE